MNTNIFCRTFRAPPGYHQQKSRFVGERNRALVKAILEAPKCLQNSVSEGSKLVSTKIRRTQEGCGGLGGENPAAFLQAQPIFQQPFSLPENAQTLAGIAFRAAGKTVNNFPAASKFARKPFHWTSSKELRTATAFSSDIPPESLVSLGFEVHTELFAPHPHLEDTHPTGRYPDQKVWVWVPFYCPIQRISP